MLKLIGVVIVFMVLAFTFPMVIPAIEIILMVAGPIGILLGLATVAFLVIMGGGGNTITYEETIHDPMSGEKMRRVVQEEFVYTDIFDDSVPVLMNSGCTATLIVALLLIVFAFL